MVHGHFMSRPTVALTAPSVRVHDHLPPTTSALGGGGGGGGGGGSHGLAGACGGGCGGGGRTGTTVKCLPTTPFDCITFLPTVALTPMLVPLGGGGGGDHGLTGACGGGCGDGGRTGSTVCLPTTPFDCTTFFPAVALTPMLVPQACCDIRKRRRTSSNSSDFIGKTA